MTEKNIFAYELFLSLNISDFSLFFMQKLQPPPWKKSTPSFQATHVEKLYEVGGVNTMRYQNNVTDVILVSYCWLSTGFTHWSEASIVDLEQMNDAWVIPLHFSKKSRDL